MIREPLEKRTARDVLGALSDPPKRWQRLLASVSVDVFPLSLSLCVWCVQRKKRRLWTSPAVDRGRPSEQSGLGAGSQIPSVQKCNVRRNCTILPKDQRINFKIRSEDGPPHVASRGNRAPSAVRRQYPERHCRCRWLSASGRFGHRSKRTGQQQQFPDSHHFTRYPFSLRNMMFRFQRKPKPKKKKNNVRQDSLLFYLVRMSTPRIFSFFLFWVSFTYVNRW